MLLILQGFSFSRLFSRVLMMVGVVCFFAIAAQAATFETYQRVKNPSAHEDAAGAATTIAQPGDALRHIVAIRNTDNHERTYSMLLQTPLLMDQTGQLEMYKDGWVAVDAGAIRLFPFETGFFRFRTKVQSSFPNENRILTMVVAVQDDTGTEKKTVTKVYVPYFTQSAPAPTEYTRIVSEERAKELLGEERAFMEQHFKKLLIDEGNQEEIAEQQVAPTPFVKMPLGIGIFGSIVLVLIGFLYVYFSRFRSS